MYTKFIGNRFIDFGTPVMSKSVIWLMKGVKIKTELFICKYFKLK